MDPVTITLLAIAGVAIAPKAVPFLLYQGMNLFTKVSKGIKKIRKRRLRKKRLAQADGSVAESYTMGRNIQRNRVVNFINTKTHALKKINVQETTSFDFSKDVLLHGVVRVRMKNGRIAEDDIYLFQPRLTGANGVSIGPKTGENGVLLDKTGYLIRVPGDTTIYRGYVPKREVLTGEEFDYARGSMYVPNGDELADFIDIEIPMDRDGNFIPVDKNDEAQVAAFHEYVRKRTKHNINQRSYLQGLILAAKESKAELDRLNAPVYAKPAKGQDPREIQRIRKARASKAKRDAQARAYYGAVNRMNMLDSMMHTYNLDEHAAHIPGTGGVIGPGMLPLSSLHNGGFIQGGPGQGGPSHGGPAPGGRSR